MWGSFAFAKDLLVAVAIIVGVPLLIGQAVVSWRIQLKNASIGRNERNKPLPAGDLSHQLEVLQQSVDAMAIEVERLSEAQRAAARPRLESPLDPRNTTPTR